MPKWVEKILKYNPGEKSLKAPCAIYLDLECLLKKEQSRENNNNNNNNNLEKSYREKKARHEPSSWAVFTKCSFDKKEKLDYCRRKDCIEKLCKKLKRRSMKIINYVKKEMIPPTNEENKSYKEQEDEEDDKDYINIKG